MQYNKNVVIKLTLLSIRQGAGVRSKGEYHDY